jgi:hypothetical protein
VTLPVLPIPGLHIRDAQPDTPLWVLLAWICVMMSAKVRKTSTTFSAISMVAVHGAGALHVL